MVGEYYRVSYYSGPKKYNAYYDKAEVDEVKKKLKALKEDNATRIEVRKKVVTWKRIKI